MGPQVIGAMYGPQAMYPPPWSQSIPGRGPPASLGRRTITHIFPPGESMRKLLAFRLPPGQGGAAKVSVRSNNNKRLATLAVDYLCQVSSNLRYFSEFAIKNVYI